MVVNSKYKETLKINEKIWKILLTSFKTDGRIVKVFSRRRRTIEHFEILNVKKLQKKFLTKYKRNDKLIKVLKKDKINYFNEVNGSKVLKNIKKLLDKHS